MTSAVLADLRYSAAEIAGLVGANPPTGEQAAIIEAPLQPNVIIAGAGSGKTETIATRVVWLIANGLIEPDRVLGLTFTRKAAGELSHRITSRLRRFRYATHSDFAAADPAGAAAAVSAADPGIAGEPTVSTYAAYAATLVDEHGLRLGAEPGARLLSNAGRWQLAWDVVCRHSGQLHDDIGVPRSVTRYVLSLADEMANHLITRDDVISATERLRQSVLAIDEPAGFALPVRTFLQRLTDRVDLLELVEQFAAAKAERHSQDFADKMRLATLLSALPSVQAAERAKFGVVLLDEYQDTSHSETVLLAQLFGDGRPVTAVGDPLQAIYGWRGASSSNITSYPTRFTSADGEPAAQYSLLTSWRNDRAILAAANTVAAAARPPEYGEQLRARPAAAAGQVRVCFAESTLTEADWIADRLADEWDTRTDWTGGARTAAVLVRKRSHIPAVVAALQARTLPVEVLSLGGLLSLPEVLEVLSTLKVLTDVQAGASLARLLTGDRWRVGLADLAALADRAMSLARAEQPCTDDGQPIGRPEPHLIDALQSLGDPSRYSNAGHQRMRQLATELSALRRRLNQPLADLVEDIVRVSGLGVELAVRGGAGRANLDRLTDEAARFSAESVGTPASFLAYLDAAKEEDRGLETVDAEVRAERIQVLTVHGAKGLEWDVVAIPGLADGSFPAAPQGESWTTGRGRVPYELRGDADALPVLQFAAAQKASEVNKTLTSFIAQVNLHRLSEERRLAYVAMTRGRKAMYCSGAAWSSNSSARTPAAYLAQLRDIAEEDYWHVVGTDDVNPLTTDITGRLWPVDALGDQRASIETAAAAVRSRSATLDSASTEADEPGRAGSPGRTDDSGCAGIPTPADSPLRAGNPWRADVDLLLRERADRIGNGTIEVAMPGVLSTSEAVAFAEDPSAFARQLRRPVPRRPSSAADRGNTFHEWLEQRFRSEALLDIDDLRSVPAADPDAVALARLRSAFLASEWADRTPLAVEVSFELPVGEAILRGRMDAVFADSDGGFTVVDWKTGSVPTGPNAVAKSVQLAAYRLAWARINGIADPDIARVRAAFHYVAVNQTVYPDQVLDAAGLVALISPSRPAASNGPRVPGGQLR